MWCSGGRVVRTHLLLLRDTVKHDLVVHRRLDIALGAEILRAVVLRKGNMGSA